MYGSAKLQNLHNPIRVPFLPVTQQTVKSAETEQALQAIEEGVGHANQEQTRQPNPPKGIPAPPYAAYHIAPEPKESRKTYDTRGE